MEWTLHASFEERWAALQKYKEPNGSLKSVKKQNITLHKWAITQKARYLEKGGYAGLPKKDVDCLHELGCDI